LKFTLNTNKTTIKITYDGIVYDMYLDNFNHPSYKKTRSINMIEAEILKQKFKNDGLSKEEAALLDKWFFTQLVKPECISAELFNE
jgi:hypothetical protein